MIAANSKPSAITKQSGAEWIEDVPGHWLVSRLKHVCRLAYGDALSADMRQRGNVAVFGSNGRVGFHHTANTQSPCIVIGRKGSFGKVRYSQEPVFAIDTTFFIDRRLSHADLRWLFYVLGWIGLDQLSKDAAVPGLSREDAYCRIVPLPPHREQTTIARFLDHIDRHVRHYFRAKQKLIALLEEQKQAFIYEAVTGRIDVRTGRPYATYRTSRAECLGSIPEHWKLARLKDVAQVQPGLTLGKDYSGIETISRPYLRVANVQDGRIDLSHVKSVEVPVHEARATTLLEGDVLMTEGGDIDKLGRGGVWRHEIPGCLHQNHIFAVRCRHESLSPEFLVGLMASSYGRSYFQLTAKQTTNLASTNSSTLRAFPIPLPSVDEQKVIVESLSRHTRLLDEAIGRTERAIHHVREYLARLINDVVTGRVDVRHALISEAGRVPVQEFEGEQEVTV